jgi:hypothetical protein
MTNVMIVCPVTELRIPIGLQVEATHAFRRRVPDSGSVRCGACGRIHSWYRAETLLDGAGSPGRRYRDVGPNGPALRYVFRPDLAEY